jgi:dihydroflavonol-4-reductase
MKVLVTGATGFLGSHIARALVAAGHSVRVLVRPETSPALLEGLPAEVARGDILVPSTLEAAARGVEAVVHSAANMRGRGGSRERAQSHVLGTRHMLAACRPAGVRRFVYISSVAALGIPDASPAPTDGDAPRLDESHMWNTDPDRWPYGHAKHLAEQEVQSAAAAGMEAVIVNPSAVLGPGDRYRVSNAVIWHMLHGRVPPVIPGGLGVVHVSDVAEGTLAALEHGRSGERYILNGENVQVEQLLSLVAEAVGLPPPRLRLSLSTARALAAALGILARIVRPQARPVLLALAGLYFYYDNGKARRELGVSFRRTARRAAEEAAEWYRRRAGRQAGSLGGV